MAALVFLFCGCLCSDLVESNMSCWAEPAQLPQAGSEERLRLSSGALPAHLRRSHSQVADLTPCQKPPRFVAGAGGGSSAWASATSSR